MLTRHVAFFISVGTASVSVTEAILSPIATIVPTWIIYVPLTLSAGTCFTQYLILEPSNYHDMINKTSVIMMTPWLGCILLCFSLDWMHDFYDHDYFLQGCIWLCELKNVLYYCRIITLSLTSWNCRPTNIVELLFGFHTHF